VLRQRIEGKCFLDNCYPQVVRPGGNPAAQRYIDSTMDVVAGNWRGIGPIPESGYVLKPGYAAHDSRVQLPSYTEMARKRAGEMPPGCDCAKVVLGKIYPNECRLYGLACTPRQPVGRAWSPTKAPAASGGRTAFARTSGPGARPPAPRRDRGRLPLACRADQP